MVLNLKPGRPPSASSCSVQTSACLYLHPTGGVDPQVSEILMKTSPHPPLGAQLLKQQEIV